MGKVHVSYRPYNQIYSITAKLPHNTTEYSVMSTCYAFVLLSCAIKTQVGTTAPKFWTKFKQPKIEGDGIIVGYII